MALSKTVLVEISTQHPFLNEYIYSGLNLPASQSRIEDALQKARAIGRDDAVFYKITDCKVIPILSQIKLESPTPDELNFFAYRLTQLSDNEKIVINAVVQNRFINEKYEEVGISMKELINLTYGLENVPVIEGIDTLEQVGQFVIDNDLDDAVIGLSDEACELISKRLVGERFMEAESGVIRNGCYVSVGNYTDTEVYDGKNLPDMPPEFGKGTIMLLVARQPKNDVSEVEADARWIGLPIDINEADRIAEELGENSINDCVYLNMRSDLGYVDGEVFTDMADFEELNKLCEEYESLSDIDKIKLKAVLIRERPENVIQARETFTRLKEYDFSYYADTYEGLGYEYMSSKLPTDFDMELLKDCYNTIGYTFKEKRGIHLTGYGCVPKHGEMLYGNVERVISQDEEEIIDEEQEEGIGGMQM